MTDTTSIAESYIASWNERDPVRRKALVAATFTEDSRYADPLMQGEGHAGIEGLIAAVQQRFPAFRFALTGAADGHGDHLRFSWALGPDDGPSLVKGTDFALAEGGRLKTVTGFLDQVPAIA
jgi:hypothetical protein